VRLAPTSDGPVAGTIGTPALYPRSRRLVNRS
jgi:hypothetical protein